MYTKGAFSYPYLEDDDPWGHAVSIKYIALEKTIYEPTPTSYLFDYLDARPPGYDSIMAVLHQTSSSLQWTMKFFNALIISLGVLFFYFFAAKILKRKDMALFSTFVLAMTPSYLSHFIWAHSLVITLFISTMMFILYAKDDKKWIIPSMFAISAILLTQETQALKFAVILIIFFGVFSLVQRKINWNIAISAIGGFFLSSVLWWIPMAVRYGGLKEIWTYGIKHGANVAVEAAKYIHPSIKNVYYGTLGSATRQHGLYTIKDFLFPKAQNMINVPIGTGWVIISLICIGLVFLIIKRKEWLNAKGSNYLLLLLLLGFSFLGIHGGMYWWSPFAFYSFRFWLLFAVFGSLVSAYGLWLILNLVKKNLVLKSIILIIVLAGIIITSGVPKYQLNTSAWGAGGSWSSDNQLKSYSAMKQNLDKNSRIFTCEPELFLIGMDMDSCYWCQDEREYKEEMIEKSPSEFKDWLKGKNYDYFVFGPRCFTKYGDEESKIFLESAKELGNFQMLIESEDFYLFKLN